MTATLVPATMAVDDRFRSAPAVEAEPSMTTVRPSDSTHLNHAAVPVLAADPEPMAFALATPPAAGEKAGEANVSVASSVWPATAVFALAGCDPL